MRFDELFHQRVTDHYTALAGNDHRWKETVPDRVFNVMSNMVDYSHDMRLRVYDYLGDKAGYRSGHVLAAIHSGSPQARVREYMAYEHALRREDGDAFLDPMVFLGSLNHYRQLPYLEDYSEVDEATRSQVIALLTIVARLHEFVTLNPNDKEQIPLLYRDDWFYREDKSITLIGNDLIQLVINNPTKAVWIAEFIIERKTDDADIIKSALSADAVALVNGLL